MQKKPTKTDKYLIGFQHYSLKLANKESKIANSEKYKVTTINWTFANQNELDFDYDKDKPSPNREECHKNQYIFTLPKLIDFIRDIEDVAEDIIEIIPYKIN